MSRAASGPYQKKAPFFFTPPISSYTGAACAGTRGPPPPFSPKTVAKVHLDPIGQLRRIQCRHGPFWTPQKKRGALRVWRCRCSPRCSAGAVPVATPTRSLLLRAAGPAAQGSPLPLAGAARLRSNKATCVGLLLLKMVPISPPGRPFLGSHSRGRSLKAVARGTGHKRRTKKALPVKRFAVQCGAVRCVYCPSRHAYPET